MFRAVINANYLEQGRVQAAGAEPRGQADAHPDWVQQGGEEERQGVGGQCQGGEGEGEGEESRQGGGREEREGRGGVEMAGWRGGEASGVGGGVVAEATEGDPGVGGEGQSLVRRQGAGRREGEGGLVL